MFVNPLHIQSSSASQEIYEQMMYLYEQVSLIYESQGKAMPDLPVNHPIDMCIMLQRMLHEHQR